MIYKRYFMACLLMVSWNMQDAKAQKVVHPLSDKQMKFAKTILEVSAYLKSQPTFIKRLDTISPKIDSFYDGLIDRYFDRERMQKEYSKNVDHFTVEGKIDIQRMVLNISDLWLDNIPSDSLYIIPVDKLNYYEKEKTDQIANSLAVVFGSNKIMLLIIWFDENSGRIIIVGTHTLAEKERLHVQKYFPALSKTKNTKPASINSNKSATENLPKLIEYGSIFLPENFAYEKPI